MSKGSDHDKMYPKGKEVEIRGEKFVIKPFVLKNRIVVIRLFSDLIQEISKDPELKTSSDQQTIMKLINAAGDRMIEVYRAVIDKPDDWLMEMDLKDELTLLEAIKEENDLDFLLQKINSLLGRELGAEKELAS